MQNKADISRQRAGNIVSKSIVYFLLGVWGLVVLFPFYWMLLTSVKSYASYNGEYIPKFFTLSPTIQNYIDAYAQCVCHQLGFVLLGRTGVLVVATGWTYER